MLETKEYVAIQDFTMSLDNGKTPIYVKRGEPLQFDGLNVVFRGEQGTARPLAKVIGEWISPTGVVVKPVGNQTVASARNVSAGRIVEHSDYPSDPTIGVKNQPSDSVDNLLKNYDKTPGVKIVNGKREVTSDLDDIKREVTVINDDANEVRKVSANDGAPVTNKSSVEIEQGKASKGVVLSQEGNVAKATNYAGKQASTGAVKKLTIDYAASGVEVGKTSANKAKVASAPAAMETFATDVEVAETSYPAAQTTDVGSSTQAQIEQRKTVKKAPVKKAAAKKAPAKKAPAKKVAVKKPVDTSDQTEDIIDDLVNGAPQVLNTKPTVAKGPMVDAGGQEAVVISKVKRDSLSSVKTEDGITSRVTVGASDDVDPGEVEFSSNNDFDEPSVTFSAGEDTPYDASEVDVMSKDEADIIDSSDDIDLNDLLSEV